MLEGEKFLYHSLLSPYINAGLLDPLAVCQRVEQAWKDGHAPLNAVEGYIRQIIGWREYMRGIYWLKCQAMSMGTFLEYAALARFLLDWANRNGLFARRDYANKRGSLCPSYPETDGHWEFRALGRD